MAVKLTDILKDAKSGDGVASRAEDYDRRYGGAARGGRDERKSDYKDFENTYYDLVTDFYEYGWGRSFHFAPRIEGESFAASLARHEHYLAHRLDLQPGMTAVDLGCGIGGSLREIARFSGARILGVNNNEYQLKRAAKLTEAEYLSHRVEYLKCDFMNVDAPDNTFDAVYAIEATCCAPDKAGVFGEAFRLLKPGGRFGAYDFCLTDLFDAQDPLHLKLKADMEYGGGLPDIARPHEMDDAMRRVGFDLLDARDLAADAPPGIPWYQPLVGSGLSFASARSSPVGRRLTRGSLWLLERLRIVPRGTAQVAAFLNVAGEAFAEAGRLGIFSPMYFLLGRKPE
ncbi:MAG: methyltransferase domain-containing protein [Rhodospirillaceae bacterium]|nr:methyltransferase domain-containing protein [Rhodospirillaceae bacterium]